MRTIWYVASTPAGVEKGGLDAGVGGVVFGNGVQVTGSDGFPRGVVGGVGGIIGICSDGLYLFCAIDNLDVEDRWIV